MVPDEDKMAGETPESGKPEAGEETARPKSILPQLSKASKDRPVPKPLRPEPEEPPQAPAGTPLETPAVDNKSKPTIGMPRPAGTGAVTKPEQTGALRSLTASGSRRAVTRPGLTQAVKVGGGGEGGRKTPLTTHALRNQDRVNIKEEIPTSYSFSDPARKEVAPKVYRGRLVDISLGGCQVEGPIPEDINPDDVSRLVVNLDVALPFVENPLEATASVSWAKPAPDGRFFIGLRFFNVVEQQRRTIRAFLIGLQSPTKLRFRRGR